MLPLLTTIVSLTAIDPVDALATTALREWSVPAVGICIVQTGRPSTVKSFGIREIGTTIPATTDDHIPLASCTKAVTSALIAKLVDERKLTFDDPVAPHLSYFHLSDPLADRMVTLRDLLTHRTGVGGHDLLWYGSPLSNRQLIERIAHLPLSEPFRGGYQYSTLMYLAAGEAAASANHSRWEEAVRNKLTTPLGMTTVSFTTTDPAFIAAPKLIGHQMRNGQLVPMPRYVIREPNAAGSMHLAIRDLEPWLRYQLRAAGALAVTHQPQMVMPITPSLQRTLPFTVQMSYGMGWIITDYHSRKLLSHGGMIDGFRNIIMLMPDAGLGIAITCNRDQSKLPLALGYALLDHQLGLPAHDWNATLQAAERADHADADASWKALLEQARGMAPRALPLEAYAGTYTHPAYGTATLSVVNNTLTWNWNALQLPLDYLGNEAFFITEGRFQRLLIEFRTENNRVQGLRFQGMLFLRTP